MVGNLFGSATSSQNSNSTYTKASDSGIKSNATVSATSSTFSSKFVPKYFTSEWSFSKIDIPGATKCIVAFTQNGPCATAGGASGTNNSKINFGIMAVCADGSYHKFVYNDKREEFTKDVYQMFVESDSKDQWCMYIKRMS